MCKSMQCALLECPQLPLLARKAVDLIFAELVYLVTLSVGFNSLSPGLNEKWPT